MTLTKLIATTFAMVGMACGPFAVTLAVTPAANAEVCGAVGGRHVEVGGCSHVVGDVAAGVALANDDEWAAQENNGQPPCYTPSGLPYYTPGADPCYP